MAKLAIEGHTTRGAEVITLLEMLGGINVDNLYGDDTYYYYYITDDEEIDAVVFKYSDDKARIFSLEEFEEKYPYKVGDKVQHKRATSCSSVYEIVKMWWNGNQVEYTVCDLYWKNIKCTETTENLKPYKEETMKEKIQAYEITGEICANEVAIEFDPSKFEMIERNGKYFVVKKQPQYPKTYKECCEVLRIPKNEHYIDIDAPLIPSNYNKLVSTFTKLLICRDAYWRIAGEQMVLGKPWEPELNSMTRKFALSNVGGHISFEVYGEYNSVLCFPTEEMRNAFFDNFKDLIEKCKELL